MSTRTSRIALTIGLAFCLSQIQTTQAASYPVSDVAMFDAAVRRLQPGDEIVLANGRWQDARLLLRGVGTAQAPIRLRAQTPGAVILSGRSDLRLAGRHLHVADLVFRDGQAPGDAVVAFRENGKAVATHSRVSGLVIDDYNPADNSAQSSWVMLYGNDNRLDHSQLRGKTNAGPTVVVVRDPRQGLDNRHRIDHNWFGPRPPLGRNGGETLRVGTSHESLSDSNTIVSENWFEGCDGEAEIISSKSGGNRYVGNVFYRSAGALTLRHGNGNEVRDNVFIGDGKPGTGGVRVINAGQRVSGNHFQGLAGTGHRAALALMQGQQQPPLNGYAPVRDADIGHNTFIDVAEIAFGVGANGDRGQVVDATRSRFHDNLLIDRQGHDPVRVLASVAGVHFADNLQSPLASPALGDGVQPQRMDVAQSADGRWQPMPARATVGAAASLQMLPRDATGVAWYPKNGPWAAPASAPHPPLPGVDR